MANIFAEEESIHLSFDMLPVARDWKNGQEYEIKIQARQSSIHENGVSFRILMADGHSVQQGDEAPHASGHGSSHGGGIMRKKKKKKNTSKGKPYNV